jgi:hypothetical protein
MNQKSLLHHEGHEDHEKFCELSSVDDIPANPNSWGCMMFTVHPQGKLDFLNDLYVFLRVLRVLRGATEGLR